jgi:hypothetical protein
MEGATLATAIVSLFSTPANSTVINLTVKVTQLQARILKREQKPTLKAVTQFLK